MLKFCKGLFKFRGHNVAFHGFHSLIYAFDLFLFLVYLFFQILFSFFHLNFCFSLLTVIIFIDFSLKHSLDITQFFLRFGNAFIKRLKMLFVTYVHVVMLMQLFLVHLELAQLEIRLQHFIQEHKVFVIFERYLTGFDLIANELRFDFIN